MRNANAWVNRCVHEAQCWENNQFVTLTYAPDFLPELGSLRFQHFQNFMKELRANESGVQRGADGQHKPIRFFGVGEYGDKFGRPHYHALLFNMRFDDLRFHARINGNDFYTSARLQKIWRKGHSLVSAVNLKTVRYVCRYPTKKLYGPMLERFLDVVDPVTGELLGRREPIFARMSLKPGLGSAWYDRFKRDLQHGYLVVGGHKSAIPRYYEKKFAAEFPMAYEDRKAERREYNPNLEPGRLAADEIVKTAMDDMRSVGKL